MRKALVVVLGYCLAAMPLAGATLGPTARGASSGGQDQPAFQPFTAEQLDNLLAPIALYPDPLLAQVLVAATFVDQVDQAARWVRSYGQNGVDDQPWDVSVRAVAHYPTVLNMMDENLDWTTAVGQAYVYQSTDVMMSIQRLRAMAQAQGNLVTTPQQQVIVGPGYIQIVPAAPRYIYVPVYDPGVIFFQPVYSTGYAMAISFGVGFLIGAWLNLDCNWANRRVYYTGWQGGGWIARSRPYVRINTVYVNNRYRSVQVNRTVIERQVNSYSIDRYRSVHGNVSYDNRVRPAPAQRAPAPFATNKVIDRNMNTRDPRLDEFRGRAPAPQPAARPVPQPSARPVPQPGRPEQAPTRPTQVRPAPAQRQPSSPTAPRQETRTPPNTFGNQNTVFNPRTASQRGQASRSQQKARPQTPHPPPKQGKPHSRGRQQ